MSQDVLLFCQTAGDTDSVIAAAKGVQTAGKMPRIVALSVMAQKRIENNTDDIAVINISEFLPDPAPEFTDKKTNPEDLPKNFTLEQLERE